MSYLGIAFLMVCMLFFEFRVDYGRKEQKIRMYSFQKIFEFLTIAIRLQPHLHSFPLAVQEHWLPHLQEWVSVILALQAQNLPPDVQEHPDPQLQTGSFTLHGHFPVELFERESHPEPQLQRVTQRHSAFPSVRFHESK